MLVRLLSDQVAAPRSILQLIPTGTMKQIAKSSVLREELAEKVTAKIKAGYKMEQSTFSECQPWKFHSMEPMTLSTINEGVPDVEQAVPPERQQIVLSPPSLELLVRKSIDAFFDND